MTRTFERKIKRLEEKSLSIPSSTFDLVKIITEQREEIERLRKLSDIEFEAYLKEAEQTLIDATDESSIAKRAALRCILQEKMRKDEPQTLSELSRAIQSLD